MVLFPPSLLQLFDFFLPVAYSNPKASPSSESLSANEKILEFLERQAYRFIRRRRIPQNWEQNNVYVSLSLQSISVLLVPAVCRKEFCSLLDTISSVFRRPVVSNCVASGCFSHQNRSGNQSRRVICGRFERGLWKLFFGSFHGSFIYDSYGHFFVVYEGFDFRLHFERRAVLSRLSLGVLGSVACALVSFTSTLGGRTDEFCGLWTLGGTSERAEGDAEAKSALFAFKFICLGDSNRKRPDAGSIGSSGLFFNAAHVDPDRQFRRSVA